MAKKPISVALFIPCYVDQFYPEVGIATLEVLEKLGCKVSFPPGQTCCGQPLANAGYQRETESTTKRFISLFQEFDYVVAPSGSCVLHVKEHARIIPELQTEQNSLRSKIFELSEFLVDVMQIEPPKGNFPLRVGFHSSCHGQRGLRLGSSSELHTPEFNKALQLLSGISGLEWVELDRKDECCGFGGTFAVTEEAISIQMGKDRLQDHLSKDAELIVGGDMSCLMHLQGIASREKKQVRFMHFAEVLNQVIA